MADKVGLVVGLNADNRVLRIRHFVSWTDIVAWVGMNNIPEGVSFIPTDGEWPPFHLCDTDIFSVISASAVVGLAFVFFSEDQILENISGMVNTYCVTSCVWMDSNVISHQRTFESFPSTRYPGLLSSCFRPCYFISF
jgi:hypothetical protein